MEQAILAASFGTTHLDTLNDNIAAVEHTLAQTFPSYPVYRAFTSGMVCRRLEARGTHVDDVATALDRMAHDGVRRLVVAPTHLIRGGEYDALVNQVRTHGDAGRSGSLGSGGVGSGSTGSGGLDSGAFGEVVFSEPLLSGVSDFRTVLDLIAKADLVDPDEALVLMGHGTSHPGNAIYAALAYEAENLGMRQTFIGTVEGYPTLDDVLDRVLAAGYRRALITPLMLVAGDHARCDMASDDPGSWKSRFTSAGILTRCLVKGLGEYAGIRQLYVDHVARAVSSLEGNARPTHSDERDGNPGPNDRNGHPAQPGADAEA